MSILPKPLVYLVIVSTDKDDDEIACYYSPHRAVEHAEKLLEQFQGREELRDNEIDREPYGRAFWLARTVRYGVREFTVRVEPATVIDLSDEVSS